VFLTQVLPFYDAQLVETAESFERAAYSILGAASTA
jgi:hypothetical protein